VQWNPKNRYVLVSDIPEASLLTDLSVNMLLMDTIEKTITKVNPTIYRKYIWFNKQVKPMLYAT